MQNNLSVPTLGLDIAFSALELQDAFQSSQTYLSPTPSLAARAILFPGRGHQLASHLPNSAPDCLLP